MKNVKHSAFQKLVWKHYKEQGRHTLPWRKTKDPYKILVSEVMLQQTQVERVVPFYKNFLKKFPSAQVLAKASLADVLRAWQGLGYNRRAKLLQEASKKLVSTPSFFPRFNLGKVVERWEALPGVGPYTARAVSVFAYGNNEIMVETNIRTAIIHHFFLTRGERHIGRAAKGCFRPKKRKVSDAEIKKILIQILPKASARKGAREWYSALMDYGAYLKRSGISHNARTQNHSKQSKFSGSLREARGAILRALAEKPLTLLALTNIFGSARKVQMKKALNALIREGFITKKGTTFSLTR
jgi:A/G-specific adenine glycosylase